MKNLFVISSLIVSSFSISCSQNSIENRNEEASLQTLRDLPENPLVMIPLTSSIQPKDKTMSTLYGNEISAKYAKEFHDFNYPKGAVLYEVTWKQKPDKVWFGGNIPKQIGKIERISFNENNEPNYEIFNGNSFNKDKIIADEVQVRTQLIISKKLAVSP